MSSPLKMEDVPLLQEAYDRALHALRQNLAARNPADAQRIRDLLANTIIEIAATGERDAGAIAVMALGRFPPMTDKEPGRPTSDAGV